MSTSWIDGAAAPIPLASPAELRESRRYRLKTVLLGKPIISEHLKHERLSKFLALGVLSSDCISSSAYGSEEMLIVLLPAFGLIGFTMLLPLTAVILAVLLLVTLSYRDVVKVYTKTGGSYVVARENFGPIVAQVAAVALMLDYIVTVAVQAAAGTAALTSAVPGLGPWTLWITVGVVLILAFGNLRGIREAGKAFALPTYFFVGSMFVVIIVGIIREVFGTLQQYPLNQPGTFPEHSTSSSVLAFASIFILLRAFANGGSSLTGLEAISNGVSMFKRPEGDNARKTLVAMSMILGTLVAGVSWLAFHTHAQPYESGTPTVISQVASAVFGSGAFGHLLFLVVQLATMLILYTGANTPFSGFPFLASFVAEDRFLPRSLMKRGHRLVFSNGIIVLTVVSIALLLGTGAHVDKLVAFYAIGVFTGFTLAGFGMAKHFANHPDGPKRGKVLLNLASGTVSLIVVLVFIVVKFNEGAWLVVVVFPIAVFALLRLHRRYRREAAALAVLTPETGTSMISRHSIVVLVDNADLATISAVRYALSLRAANLRAVHYVLDETHAEELLNTWMGQAALARVPLELIACPDRRLMSAISRLAAAETADPSTELTLLLPRRSYSSIVGRILHDQTADDIARSISKQPRVVATIIPFDVNGLLERRATVEAQIRGNGSVTATAPTAVLDRSAPTVIEEREGVTPIGSLQWRNRASVSGQVRMVHLSPMSGSPALEVELWDDSGGITLVFYGRRSIAGIKAGTRMSASGTVGEYQGKLAIANPVYELVSEEE